MVTDEKTIGLLRAIYAVNLRDGKATLKTIAKYLGEPLLETLGAIRAAKAKGLVTIDGKKGLVSILPAGRRKLKVVMIGGAFEIIHPGHIHTITEARELGNVLVVIVATDKSVSKNKGRDPVTNQDWRVRLISSLRQVDLALKGQEGSIYDILRKVLPDTVAIGYDQHHDANEIVKEAAKRGINLTAQRLETPIPQVKTSKILQSF